MKEELLPVNQIVELAKKQGVRFGKTHPQNRLRYYAKNNLIPHAKRKLKPQALSSKQTIAHYPLSTVDTLKKIQNLQDRGISVRKIKELLEKEVFILEDEVSKVDEILGHKDQIAPLLIGSTILDSFLAVSFRGAFPVLLILGVLSPSFVSFLDLKTMILTPLILLLKALLFAFPTITNF